MKIFPLQFEAGQKITIDGIEYTFEHDTVFHKEEDIIGFALEAQKKEEDMNQHPTCPWCKLMPVVANLQPMQLYCATEGCPAAGNVVSSERWRNRGPHEMKVMKIPVEEPIFILRGQDQLALMAVYTWCDTAEKKDVADEKVKGAYEIAANMDLWQRNVKSKLPD